MSDLRFNQADSESLFRPDPFCDFGRLHCLFECLLYTTLLRALGVEVESGISWFWIGTHAEYNKLIDKL